MNLMPRWSSARRYSFSTDEQYQSFEGRLHAMNTSDYVVRIIACKRSKRIFVEPEFGGHRLRQSMASV